MSLNQRFTQHLLRWHEEINDRSLPWKNETNPYFIWLSEIILQQTRTQQGWNYFLSFKEQFPTVNDLANADLDMVLKMWEGLGYYTRAKNLHVTAIHITKKLNGLFPSSYKELLKLKGIGPYTAAAIASFAYKEPVAVVDGNVVRVLSRFFALSVDSFTSAGKKAITELANSLIDKKHPNLFNQAIMDFGATICTPVAPKCPECIFQKHCSAFAADKVQAYPIRKKKIEKKKRFFLFLHINSPTHTFIQKRVYKDIWKDLYQFPLIEVANVDELNETHIPEDLEASRVEHVSGIYKQTLSHQHIFARFITLAVPVSYKNTHWTPVSNKKISSYAFPKIINSFLEDKCLLLL